MRALLLSIILLPLACLAQPGPSPSGGGGGGGISSATATNISAYQAQLATNTLANAISTTGQNGAGLTNLTAANLAGTTFPTMPPFTSWLQPNGTTWTAIGANYTVLASATHNVANATNGPSDTYTTTASLWNTNGWYSGGYNSFFPGNNFYWSIWLSLSTNHAGCCFGLTSLSIANATIGGGSDTSHNSCFFRRIPSLGDNTWQLVLSGGAGTVSVLPTAAVNTNHFLAEIRSTITGTTTNLVFSINGTQLTNLTSTAGTPLNFPVAPMGSFLSVGSIDGTAAGVRMESMYGWCAAPSSGSN